MTGTKATTDPAVASLTSALVDANDRLLGMLALITADPPPSLEQVEMIDTILDRAAPILELNRVFLSGAAEHEWVDDDRQADAAEWSTTIDVSAIGPVDIKFTRSERRFDTGDTKLLAAVARLVANAVATARVHQQTLAQEVVTREHATAAQVATAALPDASTMPNPDGLSFFAQLTPARETGGDLFTWQEVDGCVWFAMGDVSGKGLPAAVLMSTAVSAVEASISRRHAEGVVAVAALADEWLYRRLSNASMFVTLAIGVWDPETSQLTIANNGHSPIVFCTDGTPMRVEASAPPLGVLPGLLPEPWTHTTKPGDLLVLATDGFTEQPDTLGNMFGEDHFDSRIAAAAVDENHLDATRVGEQLLAEVEAHSEGCMQSDDQALMVLKFS